MTISGRIQAWAKFYVLIPLAGTLLATNACLWFALGDLSALVRAGIVVLAVLGSAVLVYFLYERSCNAGKAVITEVGEAIAAGDWVMKLAGGHSPVADIDADLPILTANVGGLADIVAPLESWLQHLKERDVGSVLASTSDVQRDMDMAKEFQQAFLNRTYPKIPEVHVEGRLRLEFFHRYEPAMALGGDFYDILKVGGDCAGVFIADVMGHGTRSALITSMLRTLIGELQPQARNAPHFLTELNKQFCTVLESLPSPLFASAFYFVPDTTGRVATFCSAGHPAPFMVRSHLKRVSRLEVPPPRASALGIIPTETFTGGHVRLIPGDVFIFFTDGVYEAHNSAGEEFGVARMEEILRKLVYRGARQMIDGIMTAITEFVGDEPILDDICLVAVEVTDKPISAGETHAGLPHDSTQT